MMNTHLAMMPDAIKVGNMEGLLEKLSQKGRLEENPFIQQNPLNAYDDVYNPILIREAIYTHFDNNNVFNALSPREKAVIEKRYLTEKNVPSLEKIADEFGLTRERIRQIESKAIRKLKQNRAKGDFLNFRLDMQQVRKYTPKPIATNLTLGRSKVDKTRVATNHTEQFGQRLQAQILPMLDAPRPEPLNEHQKALLAEIDNHGEKISNIPDFETLNFPQRDVLHSFLQGETSGYPKHREELILTKALSKLSKNPAIHQALNAIEGGVKDEEFANLDDTDVKKMIPVQGEATQAKPKTLKLTDVTKEQFNAALQTLTLEELGALSLWHGIGLTPKLDSFLELTRLFKLEAEYLAKTMTQGREKMATALNLKRLSSSGLESLVRQINALK
jgi:Sigma-70, region 4